MVAVGTSICWRGKRRVRKVAKLHAPADRALHVWIEPWADGIVVPAGTCVEIRAAAEVDGRLEVDGLSDRTVVYGWAGSTIRVLANEQIVRSFDEPFPDIPPGMSMKAFVTMVFGEPPRPEASKPNSWWQQLSARICK